MARLIFETVHRLHPQTTRVSSLIHVPGVGEHAVQTSRRNAVHGRALVPHPDRAVAEFPPVRRADEHGGQRQQHGPEHQGLRDPEGDAADRDNLSHCRLAVPVVARRRFDISRRVRHRRQRRPRGHATRTGTRHQPHGDLGHHERYHCHRLRAHHVEHTGRHTQGHKPLR